MMVWHEAPSDDTKLLPVPKTHGCKIVFHLSPTFCLRAPVLLQPLSLHREETFRFPSEPPSFAVGRNVWHNDIAFQEGNTHFTIPKTGFFSSRPPPLPHNSFWFPRRSKEHCLPSQHPPVLLQEGRRRGVQPKRGFPPGRQEQSATKDVFHLNANPAPADL